MNLLHRFASLRLRRSVPRSIAAALAVLVGLGAGAAACSTDREDFVDEGVEDLGTSSDAMTICPKDKSKTVLGIDVSYYQGNIDWNQVKTTSVKFAIARKNDGTFMDPQFQKNWDGIKAAGLIRGAYQYFRPDSDPTVQANVIIDAVGKLGDGDLPVMIDVEEPSGLSTSAYTQRIKTWMDLVEAGTGKLPMVYTGKYIWQDEVATTMFNDSALMHAGYPNACYPGTGNATLNCWMNSCPNIADQFDGWEFWQYTSKGTVSGISGQVDMDIFNGTMAELQLLAGGGYGAKLVSVDVPTTVVAGETITAHVTFKNTGGPAWDGDTRLGTTEPRDRDSAFAAPSWEKPNRAAAVDGSVKSGEEYTFDFEMVAPTELGTYAESFGLVQEGVTWFADEGGPDDEAVTLQIQVVDKPPSSVNAAVSSSASTGGAGGGDGGEGGGGGGNDKLSDPTCDCSTPHDGGAGAGWAGAVIAGLGVAIARRRRAMR